MAGLEETRELENELIKRSREVARVKDEKTKLQGKIENMQYRNDELLEKMSGLDGQVNIWRAKSSELEEEVTLQRAKVQKSAEELEQLRERHLQEIEDIGKGVKLPGAVTVKIRQLEQKLDEEQKAHAATKTILEQSDEVAAERLRTSSDNFEKLKDAESHNTELQEQITSLNNEITEVNAKSSQLQEEMVQLRENHMQQLQKLEMERQQDAEANEVLSAKIGALENALSEEHSLLTAAKAAKEEEEQVHLATKTLLEQSQQAAVESLEKLQAAEAQIKELLETTTCLKTTSTRLEEEMAQLRERHEREAEASRREGVETSETLLGKIHQLELDLSEERKAHRDAKTERDEERQAHDATKGALQHSEQAARESLQKLAQRNDTIKDLESHRDKLLEKVAGLNADIKERKAGACKLEEEMALLRERHEQVSELRKREGMQATEDLVSRISQLEEELSEERRARDSARGEHSGAERPHPPAQDVLEQSEQLQDAEANDSSDLLQKVSALESQVTVWTTRSSELERELSQLQRRHGEEVEVRRKGDQAVEALTKQVLQVEQALEDERTSHAASRKALLETQKELGSQRGAVQAGAEEVSHSLGPACDLETEPPMSGGDESTDDARSSEMELMERTLHDERQAHQATKVSLERSEQAKEDALRRLTENAAKLQETEAQLASSTLQISSSATKIAVAKKLLQRQLEAEAAVARAARMDKEIAEMKLRRVAEERHVFREQASMAAEELYTRQVLGRTELNGVLEETWDAVTLDDESQRQPSLERPFWDTVSRALEESWEAVALVRGESQSMLSLVSLEKPWEEQEEENGYSGLQMHGE